ncbi:hypothetical protein [Draconibacterium mangrovi]|uniref:hypothetical protein n=1 Tax=Draconibacterium mangrovi TaxID=2697469 RepID=UPI0013D18F8F|nr:hypothetical protein [Draconibacterium mangrovi]
MITLDSFIAINKLSVKNIQIESKKVKASYCIKNYNGESESYDLAYTYEKPYFNKKFYRDVNLASMMLAQVALNYGLFCETIEFDGLYDKTDQQFILDMMENTSREILTNKLRIKNEFLKPAYNNLQPEKRERYTQAKINFINSQYNNLKADANVVQVDMDKYAILSSGGKDSLLTYGIISEIGKPHPVFINEAGRHWFTALNSYRYFKQHEPNTEKPWCNSDRLFNWMLKHLPFIKENYASIRADIYPIRLWTVAVFLFGVLPIVLQNGLGNILIGDEYDTTIKGNLCGISHYNALYDQSKYFDNAMTRYFIRKGWNTCQYSILRSLSEMLIMKILIKRYPELQQHQISCHAAHKLGERMFPCGKCEKCRRIIGMIKALDEDPGKCGYDKTQILYGLHALACRSIKQINSDAAHLYYSLLDKQLIEENAFTRSTAKRHPEILKLRFDKERSNLEDMPQHIRKPLFEILSQYSNGAVLREKHQWREIVLNDDYLNKIKYKYNERYQ